MDLNDAVTRFYRAYLEAWNQRDFEALAGFIDVPCMVVMPGGAECFADPAEYLARQRRSFAEYEARGYSHNTVGEITVSPLGEGLAGVDAPDVCRMHVDGSVMERRRAHYLVRLTPDGWRFCVVASAILA